MSKCQDSWLVPTRYQRTRVFEVMKSWLFVLTSKLILKVRFQSYDSTWHHMTSHDITWHDWHHMTSHDMTWHHATAQHHRAFSILLLRLTMDGNKICCKYNAYSHWTSLIPCSQVWEHNYIQDQLLLVETLKFPSLSLCEPKTKNWWRITTYTKTNTYTVSSLLTFC